MKIECSRQKIEGARDFSYNSAVGNWWIERAADRAHRRAYKNIANYVRNSISGDPGVIVDYACGAGNLLSLLSRKFPNSQLIGLDGSSLLLKFAQKRLARLPSGCARRISLMETCLPRPIRLRRRADVVTFCFPNMMPAHSGKMRGVKLKLSEEDHRIARELSAATEPGDPLGYLPDPEGAADILEYGRSISKNLRQLLVRGGICVRAEYATTRRHEWSQLELLTVSFEEGSLETDLGGTPRRPWFRVLASAFFRSNVLDDVFQQTEDERDKNGGYLITILRAI
jgi:SAM-dependent methyltransferase